MNYRKQIETAAKSEGSIKAAADKLEISASYLGDIIAGRRTLSLAMSFRLEELFKLNGLALLQDQLREEWEQTVLSSRSARIPVPNQAAKKGRRMSGLVRELAEEERKAT